METFFCSLDLHIELFCSVFRYFRHAAGSLVILSKNLAQYININRLVSLSYLHNNEKVMFVGIFATDLGSFSSAAWLPQFSILADEVWHLDPDAITFEEHENEEGLNMN